MKESYKYIIQLWPLCRMMHLPTWTSSAVENSETVRTDSGDALVSSAALVFILRSPYR